MSLRIKLVGFAALMALSASAFAAEVAVLRNGFNIRHQRREVMGSTTRLYFESGAQSGWMDVATEDIVAYQREEVEIPEASPPLQAEGIPGMVEAASDRHQVDADLITSVIQAESGFNPRARSPKGAQGLMQLMPTTAGQLGVKDAYEPGVNIEGGTRYLRQLLEQYDGDLVKALAAYNAGPERVQQYKGVPPYRETRNYVRRVITDFNRKKVEQKKSTAAAGAAKKSGKKTSKTGPSVAETSPPRP